MAKTKANLEKCAFVKPKTAAMSPEYYFNRTQGRS
uniref:Uncharacterized protein n=1 Tax=Arundo donax TaxID=35708 RepID=A0A0A9BYF6_ARUDO